MSAFRYAAGRGLALILVTGIAITTGRGVSGASPPAWTEFTSASEHLSVLMPETPRASEEHDESFIGDITTIVHTARDGVDTYTVDYTTLPSFAISFSGRDGIYEHAKNAVLKDTLSNAITYTDVTLSGVKGKRLVYDTPTKPNHPEMHGEARFFLVGHRLYTVDAVVEMAGAQDKLERYFSSLQITN